MTVLNKIEELKRMDAEIMEYGDEDLMEYWWTYAVPNDPTEDDFDFIANDDELFADCLRVYKNIKREME